LKRSGSVLEFSPPMPNPSKRMVSFAFQLRERGQAALEVFDVLGRHLRRWTWRDLPPGLHRVDWDGRDEEGSPVTPGVMFCRLRAGGEIKIQKLVLRP
jgi:hypothetical protein